VFTLFTLLLLPNLAARTSASELVFRLSADPQTLDWNLAHSSYETYIIMNLMDGLVEEGEDLRPRPALAEKWELSKDGKTYTFFLRNGVNWSDGRSLRASDFVDSWIRLLSPQTGSQYAQFLFEIENAEAFHRGQIKKPELIGVRAVGDHKLVVKLRQPLPYFIHLLSFWVTFPIRLDLIKQHGDEWTLPEKIATLGPFLLSSWKKGNQLVLRKNPNYRGIIPSVDQVRAIIEADDQRARTLFEQGKIDFLADATTSDVIRFQSEQKKIRIKHYPYLSTYYLAFNIKSKFLKNIYIRKALSGSIDRKALASALQGGHQAATGWLPPGIPGHRNASNPSLELYEARANLAKAGYPDGSGFPKLTLWIEKVDGAETLGAFLKKTWKENLGIDVGFEIPQPEDLQQALKMGVTDLFVKHWGADFPDPANFFDVFTSSSPANWTNWTSVEYDRLAFKARTINDENKRLLLYGAAEKILVNSDSVIVPLFFKPTTVLLGPKIKSLSISPLNYLFFKTVHLNK